MNAPIIITGTPRSGIWLVAGVVANCGAVGGHVDLGRPGTLTPTLENRLLRQTVESAFLKGQGVDHWGLNTTPDLARLKGLAPKLGAEWRRRVDKIFQLQGVGTQERVYIVSPVAGLLWPLWNNAYPDAFWILCRRDTAQSIEALRRTGYYSDKRPASSWQWLFSVYEEYFDAAKSAGLNINEIWPGKIIAGELDEIQNAVKAVGLKYFGERITDYLGPIHWRFGHYVKE